MVRDLIEEVCRIIVAMKSHCWSKDSKDGSHYEKGSSSQSGKDGGDSGSLFMVFDSLSEQ